MDATSIRAALTFGVAALAAYVILFRPRDHKAREWAFGTLGLMLGLDGLPRSATLPERPSGSASEPGSGAGEPSRRSTPETASGEPLEAINAGDGAG